MDKITHENVLIMWLTIFFFLLGFALVVKGGDYFVESSVSIAKHLNVPRILIGTTIVSLATTSPELIVSATASYKGNPGFALGNAIGSVIANTGLIGAIVAILVPFNIKPSELRVPSLLMLAVAVIFFALTLDLKLSVWRGSLLLAMGLASTLWDSLRKRSNKKSVEKIVSNDSQGLITIRPLHASIILFAFGFLLIIVGSKFLVDSGVAIARAIGVSPMLIGLTLVAVGTSLPEMITAISSALKGVPDLSVGNILGANIMNMTLVAGTATVISPLHMTRATQTYNLPAMLIMLLIFIILTTRGGAFTRIKGSFLLVLYIFYITGLLFIPS